MNKIISEFNGSIERIRNNFYFSFLALNFVNQKPFSGEIPLNIDNLNLKISAESLNNFDNEGVEEYVNSIRRHFLNDIVIAYERYSTLMFVSHQNNKVYIDPSTIDDRNINAPKFEQLNNIYSPVEQKFLVQLRRFRNSIVHYNGKYSATNVLDYTFGTQTYKSLGNEGNNISISFENIIWIHEKLKNIVNSGNKKYNNFY